MRILMIGTDRNLLKEGSAVRSRSIEYGERVDELHIILFTKKNNDLQPTTYNLSPHVFVYPTESRNRWWYIFDALRIGRRILRDAVGDWVITAQDTAETGLVGWRLKMLYKLPLQLQMHTDVFSPYYKNASLLNRIRVFLSTFLISRADQIRVVSLRIKELLVTRGISEEDVVTLPIYVSPITHNLKPKTPNKPFETIILMVDRLEYEKNVLAGIEAFASIAKKHTNAGLVIVGDGSLRASLEEKVAELHLVHRVHFVGWVTDVSKYYMEADIFLHTSLYEGYGLVFVEAGQYALPIVTSDVGIVGEILIAGESALVCAPGDIPCLAGSLSRCIESTELRSVYGDAAKKALSKATEMSEDAYYDMQVALWERCLK